MVQKFIKSSMDVKNTMQFSNERALQETNIKVVQIRVGNASVRLQPPKHEPRVGKCKQLDTGE